MKILVDMNLSPSWIPLFEAEGYETKHWSQIGSPSAPDTEVMQWARENGFVVFTHDLDYGTLLFVTQTTAPSVIQLRFEDVRPKSVGKIVLQTLWEVKNQIEQGALVTVDIRKSRIHLLPFGEKKRQQTNPVDHQKS